MVYFTWSEGYRPGGINRRGTLPPYQADVLTNVEFGWKTSWLDNRVTFNGSIFQERWKDFQFAVLGANGLTEIRNANQAQIRGMEAELAWAASYNLTLTGGFAYHDAKLTADYCAKTDPSTGLPVPACYDPSVPYDFAPKGSTLPVTATFKGNLTARYTWNIGDYETYWQGTYVHEGKRRSDLRVTQSDILGDLPGYDTFDFSIGIKKDSWSVDLFIKNAFDQRAQLSRFTQCAESVCGASGYDAQYPNGQVYVLPAQPRTIGVRFEQTF
jgi:outer membrane receptor protein involved in Fe transport